MPSTEEIVRVYHDQKAQRHNWDRVWQQISELMAPHLSNIETKVFEGEKLTRELFDSTGVDALNKLTNALVSSISGMWFSLRMRDEELNFNGEVSLWLDQVARRMFTALNASNFRSAIHETMRSIAGFGTGCVFMEEVKSGGRGFRGLRFLSIPIGTYVIGENGFGVVDTVVREDPMALIEIVRHWGMEALHPDRRHVFENDPYRRIPVLHSVQPQSKMVVKPWESKYIDLEKTFLMTEPKMFPEFPYFVPRWDKTSGETWGRGPGHDAVPEVATLNRARQYKLEQWALQIYPPLNVLESGIVNTPKIIPGGLNVVRQLGAIEPLNTGVRFDHTAIPEEESKLQIRQIFLTEQLLQFDRQGRTPSTATEILQRLEFLHQLLGPAVARSQKELFIPLLDRQFNIMMKAGALPLPPSILRGEEIIDINFEGPLARAQRADEMRSLQDALIFAQTLAQIDPNSLDNFDTDLITRDSMRLTGSRMRYLRPPEVVEQIRQQRLQQLQAQQQLAALESAGKSAKDFSNAGNSIGGASGDLVSSSLPI